jgi:hypothetical protein
MFVLTKTRINNIIIKMNAPLNNKIIVILKTPDGDPTLLWEKVFKTRSI